MVGSERNTRMRKLSATILFIVFVLAVQGYAQSITGSLNGHVVDQQGSAVPNANVTAIEATKKLTVATNTTGAGDFSIAGLAPGNYSIAVEASGFKKLTRADVPLDASDKIALGDLVVQIRGSHRDGRSQRHGDDSTDGKQRTRLCRHRHADCEHRSEEHTSEFQSPCNLV